MLDDIEPVRPTIETVLILLIFILICVGSGIAIGYYLPH